MITYVIALGINSAVVARAASLEEAYAARLVHARDRRAVELARVEYDRGRVARLRCEIQSGRGLAPVACYEVLDLETKWRVRTSGSRRSELRRLDDDCARASEQLRVPESATAGRGLSDDCRRRVREALETIRYRAGGWSAD